jgi:putative effector of murein hydrolase
MSELHDSVAWLSTLPLTWLALTLAVWVMAERLAVAVKGHALANPVLVSVIAIVLLLKLSGTTYAHYLAGVQLTQALIGPAVVAIAVPMFRNWPVVVRNAAPIALALPAGCITAVVAAVLISRACALPDVMVSSLAPKSATTGVAMAVSQGIGGQAAMTATFTVATSIVVAVVLVPLMRVLRIKDSATIGFAAGLTGHAVGTARAFQIDAVAGTFAGIALCLNAVLTALIVPLMLR